MAYQFCGEREIADGGQGSREVGAKRVPAHKSQHRSTMTSRTGCGGGCCSSGFTTTKGQVNVKVTFTAGKGDVNLTFTTPLPRANPGVMRGATSEILRIEGYKDTLNRIHLPECRLYRLKETWPSRSSIRAEIEPGE